LKTKLLLPFAALFILASCKKSEDAPEVEPPVVNPPTTTPYTPDNSFKIVAYFPSYRDPVSVDVKKYKMITHLFYAFLTPHSSGNGSLNALEQPQRFETVTRTARQNGVKVGISLSGTSSYYVQIASQASSRSVFVRNVLNFARNYNLDGVDMDWEYPSTATSINSADNYILLMKEMSDSLHKYNKFLSAAITPGVYAGTIKDGIKPAVFPHVDFFNIMMYDGIGWDKDEPGQHASYKMSERSLDVWLIEKGMPKEKAVTGIPAYGKTSDNTSRAFRDFENQGADVSLDSASYNGVKYYFNGTNTVKKKAVLAKQRANGIMFWEFYHDSNSDNSLLKAANDAIGRSYN